MKLFLTLSVLIPALFITTLKACGQEKSKKDSIHFFEGTWKATLGKAKAENKYIFLDAYASWCVPCKTMEREVYRDSKVAAYFNEKFIAIKVDMEKGEGPTLAKRFPSIDGYPSLLFFDPNGNLNKTILGSRHTEDFLKEAKLVAK